MALRTYAFRLFWALISCYKSVRGRLAGLEVPLQFSADVHITSHLINETQAYPPWRTHMKLYYDLTLGRARADVLSGHQEGKSFIRRYDQKWEYMVKGGVYPECLRSYLGERMPIPDLPSMAVLQDYVLIDGQRCEHWIADEGSSRVHIWFSVLPFRAPRRLTDTRVENTDQEIALMSYDFHNVTIGPQADERFTLPSGYKHEMCTWFMGGFPYIHAFHHYLRF